MTSNRDTKLWFIIGAACIVACSACGAFGMYAGMAVERSRYNALREKTLLELDDLKRVSAEQQMLVLDLKSNWDAMQSLYSKLQKSYEEEREAHHQLAIYTRQLEASSDPLALEVLRKAHSLGKAIGN